MHKIPNQGLTGCLKPSHRCFFTTTPGSDVDSLVSTREDKLLFYDSPRQRLKSIRRGSLQQAFSCGLFFFFSIGRMWRNVSLQVFSEHLLVVHCHLKLQVFFIFYFIFYNHCHNAVGGEVAGGRTRLCWTRVEKFEVVSQQSLHLFHRTNHLSHPLSLTMVF